MWQRHGLSDGRDDVVGVRLNESLDEIRAASVRVQPNARRAVFLDRDGVLNERLPADSYVSSAAAFRWLPGAADAVAEFASAGYLPVVVSNQRGVARGIVSRRALNEIEQSMQRELSERQTAIAAFYYCTHDLGAGCRCRKPAPGLLLRAAAELGLRLEASLMIGDTESDIEAGRAAGCRTIRLAPKETVSSADDVYPSLAAAAAGVLGRSASSR